VGSLLAIYDGVTTKTGEKRGVMQRESNAKATSTLLTGGLDVDASEGTGNLAEKSANGTLISALCQRCATLT